MPRHRIHAAIVAACLAASIGVSTACADVVLQNDGFIDGQSVGFQGGFVVGEMAGVRLTPPGPFPMQVTRVQFLFGGAAGTRTITLRIYDDPGPGSAPGAQLFFGDYQVTASNTLLQEIDLTGDNVFVAGQFRVAIEFQHSGLPSVARDGDGTIQAARNFIYASLGSWFDSQLFGLTGDWVVRASVTSGTPGPANPPRILSVLDVGNDQGRQVRVRFQRSAQDSAGAATPITSYEVLRRQEFAAEPGREGFGLRLDGWDYVTSVPAHGESIYSVIVPTLADSTIVDGMHWTAFIVRAATASPPVFFDSDADSGYSLDNLAPGAPTNLVANAGQIAWDPAPEADFDYFTVYGSNQPVLDPGAVQLAQTTATGFDATGLPYSYILVAATDFAGNEGPAAAADVATGIREPVAQRSPALLAQPNPFRARTTVSFDLPRAESVTVSVYDAAGRRVRSLAGGVRAAGRHALDWDGRDDTGRHVANGVYLVRLEADSHRDQQKVVLMR